jgi:hypothetical protein
LVPIYPQAHQSDSNSEFNLLNTNLVVPAGCRLISDQQPQASAPPLRRCTTKEGTIMTKSLLTGMAVCAALAILAGGADARKAQKAPIRTTGTAPSISSLTAKGGPLHDCVHVTFPQCSGRGQTGPND